MKTADDLIPSVSNRIYRIRCAIVHTKFTENDNITILPFSEDEENIKNDIILIKKLLKKF